MTAVVDNTSGDFALDDLSAELALPAGTSLSGGTNPYLDDVVEIGEVATASWDIEITEPGDKSFSVVAAGTINGEPFSESDGATLTVDSTPPVVLIVPPPAVSTTASPSFSWSATDAQSAVADYDVESAIDSGPWSPLLTATTLTMTTVTGAEGEVVHLRVRSRDTLGNESDWSEVSTTIDVDSTPPTVTAPAPPLYSATASPTFNWSATDSQGAVAGYDVDAAIDQGGWVSQLTNSSQTSLTLTAGEGQLVRLRVRATDELGNTSAWTEVSTTIDAIPPVVSFGPPDNSVRGTVKVQVFLTNAGSPVTGRFTFADTDGGRTGVVANGQYVSYKNTTSKQIQAFLRATATDALGRSATGTQAYPVQTRLAPNGMRVLSLSRVGRYVKITGATQKTYNGKVTFSAKRVGSKGTKKASKRVRVKKGRFTIKLRVADGRYKFTVSAGSTSVYAASSISKNLTVR